LRDIHPQPPGKVTYPAMRVPAGGDRVVRRV
jgi:hypothetical protein